MSKLIIGCFLAAFFMAISLPADTLNNWPYQTSTPKKQRIFSTRADVDSLKFDICPLPGQKAESEDIAIFCKGVR